MHTHLHMCLEQAGCGIVDEIIFRPNQTAMKFSCGEFQYCHSLVYLSSSVSEASRNCIRITGRKGDSINDI